MKGQRNKRSQNATSPYFPLGMCRIVVKKSNNATQWNQNRAKSYAGRAGLGSSKPKLVRGRAAASSCVLGPGAGEPMRWGLGAHGRREHSAKAESCYEDTKEQKKAEHEKDNMQGLVS